MHIAYLLYRPIGMCPRPVSNLDLNHHHIVIMYDRVAKMTHKFSDFFTFVQGLLQPQTNFSFIQILKLLTPHPSLMTTTNSKGFLWWALVVKSPLGIFIKYEDDFYHHHSVIVNGAKILADTKLEGI